MWGRLRLRENKKKHESIGSIAANQDYIEHSKEAGREATTVDVEGVGPHCRV